MGGGLEGDCRMIGGRLGEVGGGEEEDWRTGGGSEEDRRRVGGGLEKDWRRMFR